MFGDVVSKRKDRTQLARSPWIVRYSLSRQKTNLHTLLNTTQ